MKNSLILFTLRSDNNITKLRLVVNIVVNDEYRHLIVNLFKKLFSDLQDFYNPVVGH
ncbi:hypothetical protein DRO97_05130 [Archaeoglobales archaeon]|nr:MAG: hypothetical protein DRO97_05130 [Archaeoglobales archaeon]